MIEHLKNTDIDYTDIAKYIPDVMNAMYNEQAYNIVGLKEIRDAFRIKMMQSKAWLVQKFLKLDIDKNSKILVVGGWLGFTSYVLFKNGYSNIVEIDVDSRLQFFSMHLNRNNMSFSHFALDVNSVDTSFYDVVINTSCEHIIDNVWFNKIKKNSMLIFQSNNIDIVDHVNKCNSLDEMLEKYPMLLQYGGTLDYSDGTKRFMMIGKKLT